MADPVQRRREADAQWEFYAKSMRGFTARVVPGVMLMMVSAAAAAWVAPIWTAEIPTAAPYVFASALALVSAACFGGFLYVFAKNRLASPPHTQPSRGSKAAFLLREWAAGQRRGAILICCATQLLCAWSIYPAFGLAESGEAVLQMLGAAPILLGVVTVLFTFVIGVQDDEFEAAMRARAAQIGYWTALIVVTGVMLAGLWLGLAVLPLLPFAFMLMVVVPSLSFVALTHERRES